MQPIAMENVATASPATTVLDKVDVDLTFNAHSPMWYFPEADNTTWSRWHTEQLGKVQGTIKHGDATHEFNGVGYRDHSRGPRYLSEFRGHSWIQGQFPEGDAFALYQMWQIVEGREIEALSEAKLYKDGAFTAARVVSSPRLTSSCDILGDYELVLETKQERLTIIGKPRGLAFFSYGTLMSHFLPNIPTGVTEFFMTNAEQPSTFIFNGRKAIGHTERSYYRGHAEKVFDGAILRADFTRKD
jgi:hypothetical protein